ncbi:oligosaccharide flippase family protein [Rhizobacter sp. AJA081-3]|uniref:lipopolysaccharide biosynthesis protein n=1 Tax=Rhizobacter sp. AJA081-3 TaxID=2753607 RepID=UPI001ADFF559|nr:oligosaccharide flippase family protein [Rhizobacter sp. AJA081-3]QTN24263.1 oligosaccharide flippase family protein [Rhizobacter sp. AJA081-3]
MADIAVMAVGGFLLLPLYTRTLSQAEFGMYVAVRANTDILTYLLHFGLISAVARLYFDHRKQGRAHEYLSSVFSFYLALLAIAAVLLQFLGAPLWAQLSPTTPAWPYLGFSLALAAFGFPAALASLWLRMENRAFAMVALQLSAALVLAVAAAILLVVFDAGLPGLLSALLVSAACAAAALPWLFGRRFRLVIQRADIAETLRYALPILVGYLAYFVLNRLSTLILQRHVGVDQVAIYGLAQQLAMIVAIAGTSFGMALQPAIFAAEPGQVGAMLRRSGRILAILMFAVTAVLILFAGELFALVAPRSYGSGQQILLLLLLANFGNAFTLMSDTALLYHRRPKTSVAVSIVGALAATGLGLWLVPLLHLPGAALSLLGAFTVRMLISHWLAYRVTGYSALGTMAASFAVLGAIAAFAAWLPQQSLAAAAAVVAKLLVVALALGLATFAYRKSRPPPCAK